jgi:hypothetical protein
MFSSLSGKCWPPGACQPASEIDSPLDPVPPDAAGRFGAANTYGNYVDHNITALMLRRQLCGERGERCGWVRIIAAVTFT